MTSLSLEITAVNPAYKKLPKVDDLFIVTQVLRSEDSIFGERVTVIFKSTTERDVITNATLQTVTDHMKKDLFGSEAEYPAKGDG